MKILTARLFVYVLHACCLHSLRIDSSQDRLAHTLARLPDTRKSTSDLISPILARYDSKKKKKTFHMTVEPSYGRKGGRFRMTVGPSYGRGGLKVKKNKLRQIFITQI